MRAKYAVAMTPRATAIGRARGIGSAACYAEPAAPLALAVHALPAGNLAFAGGAGARSWPRRTRQGQLENAVHPDIVHALRDVFTRSRPSQVEFSVTNKFPGVLYLAPAPDDLFGA